MLAETAVASAPATTAAPARRVTASRAASDRDGHLGDSRVLRGEQSNTSVIYRRHEQ